MFFVVELGLQLMQMLLSGYLCVFEPVMLSVGVLKRGFQRLNLHLVSLLLFTLLPGQHFFGSIHLLSMDFTAPLALFFEETMVFLDKLLSQLSIFEDLLIEALLDMTHLILVTFL